VLRRELTNIVSVDLSLPVLIESMLGSEEAWKTAVSFCEAVMLQKEAAERICRQKAAAEETAAVAAAAMVAMNSSEEEEETGEKVQLPHPRPPLLYGEVGAYEGSRLPKWGGKIKGGMRQGRG